MIVRLLYGGVLCLILCWANCFCVSSQAIADYPSAWNERLSKCYYRGGNDCHCGSTHIDKPSVRLSQYFSLVFGGGISGLTYVSDFGGLSPAANALFGVTYSFYIRGKAGLKFGVDLAYAGSKYEAVSYHDLYSVVDVEKDVMDVYYTVDKISERHNQWLLEIPFQLALRFDPITIDIGPKISIPIVRNYQEQLSGVDLRCYYPTYDVEIDKAIALAADKYAETTVNDKIDYFPACWISLSANFAYSFMLKSGNELGLGVYADYALNRYKNQRTRNLSLVSITDTHDGIPVERLSESVLQSNHALSGKQVVSEFGYFCVGLKLTYDITLKAKK
ncbi:MAG: hypothetical protein PHH23_03455 [Paludibacteraceae bacterium]|nr:hypothetical protein [Paludibacteraceae bacterium]